MVLRVVVSKPEPLLAITVRQLGVMATGQALVIQEAPSPRHAERTIVTLRPKPHVQLPATTVQPLGVTLHIVIHPADVKWQTNRMKPALVLP